MVRVHSPRRGPPGRSGPAAAAPSPGTREAGTSAPLAPPYPCRARLHPSSTNLSVSKIEIKHQVLKNFTLVTFLQWASFFPPQTLMNMLFLQWAPFSLLSTSMPPNNASTLRSRENSGSSESCFLKPHFMCTFALTVKIVVIFAVLKQFFLCICT